MALVRHNFGSLAATTNKINKNNVFIGATNICAQFRHNTTLPANTDQVEQEVIPRRPAMVNKSRLLPQHRNMLHNERPYESAQSWIHLTEKYNRSIYGRYGEEKSGINPRICFATKEELAAQKRYEKIAFPKTVPTLLAELAEERKLKEQQIQEREITIAKKIEKLDVWKKELHEKVAKKEADALAAKQKKERLIEEVRRHFGFNVDPRDERFKEMLEQKEKEDKKKQKEAKRKAKEEKLIAKLVQN